MWRKRMRKGKRKLYKTARRRIQKGKAAGRRRKKALKQLEEDI